MVKCWRLLRAVPLDVVEEEGHRAAQCRWATGKSGRLLCAVILEAVAQQGRRAVQCRWTTEQDSSHCAVQCRWTTGQDLATARCSALGDRRSALCSAVGHWTRWRLKDNWQKTNIMVMCWHSRRAVPLDHWTRWRVKDSLEKIKPNGKGWHPLRAVPLDIVRNQATAP